MVSNRPVFLRPLEESYAPYRELVLWRRRFWFSVLLWGGLVGYLVLAGRR